MAQSRYDDEHESIRSHVSRETGRAVPDFTSEDKAHVGRHLMGTRKSVARGRGDIQLPNETRTIDPRLPDAPRRQYQMDVVDLEAPASKDPKKQAQRKLQHGRMQRYMTTRDRSLKGAR